MTLIIGARYRDGVILVADRKITNTYDMEKGAFDNKFIQPLGNVLAFGCAGYLNKIREFDRKIKEIVNERQRELFLKNMAYYQQYGFEYKKEEIMEAKPEQLTQEEQKETKQSKPKKEKVMTPPQDVYVYSPERFIDDCKFLIREVCTNGNNITSNDVELLLILFSEVPKLHHIAWMGEEEEVIEFCAIGSGSHLVNYILNQHWRQDMDVAQILKLCFFCIYYIQDLKIDNSVGVETNGAPDHLVIVNDEGIKYWNYNDEQKKEMINDIKEKIKNLKTTLEGVSF